MRKALTWTRPTAAALLLLATAACSTTSFQSTWRNPEARPLKFVGRSGRGHLRERQSGAATDRGGRHGPGDQRPGREGRCRLHGPG